MATATPLSAKSTMLGRAKEVLTQYPELDSEQFIESVEDYLDSKPEIDMKEASDQTILRALDEIDMEDGRPNWTFIASSLFSEQLYHDAAANRGYKEEDKYGSYVELVHTLVDAGIYNRNIIEDYSDQEIALLQQLIKPERDKAFTYIGLYTLADRYMAKSHDGGVMELPQERFLLIAMALMRKESKLNGYRSLLIAEAYDVLSKRYMTVATPTFSNAGKAHGQFSSCFIDTVADDLRSIYDSNSDIADLSKDGGGIGVYMGKIRSRGSDIKKYPGISQGVLPWMKQLNNTAVSVDQLGQRSGAIAVYLDVFHKDIFSFCDAKLNNGDERKRTHDLFMGVTIPDLFMEQVDARGDWYIFDPHTIESVLGFRLEDYFDEEIGKGSFRTKYAEAVAAAEAGRMGKAGKLWEKVNAIDIMKRIMVSQLETGTPFMFYRDEVNRMNPNKKYRADGTAIATIYCSNLCTEITQNQSPTTVESVVTEDGKIIITKNPGDFVVCNLSSINLGEVYKMEGDNFYPALRKLIKIQVRMLDNVIDLNNIPVPQAQLTNQRYRAIGLGTFGWAHLLALKGIAWEDEEAVELADELYEFIGFCTIEASMELAHEKGAFPMFKGSEWDTGEYFTRRDYIENIETKEDVQGNLFVVSVENVKADGLDWAGLFMKVARYGVRNGWMMAVAPNATTALIAGSSASTDPIYRKFYSEEKKDYKIPVTAPDLNDETTWFYESAYLVDQHASIRQNAKRQRHIDQAISFNFYVPNTVKAADLLALHMDAWQSRFKTTYYVRSTSQKVIDECESCAS